MIKVIINADDLGISHTVNNEISKALDNHSITSATILANSETWNEVHAIIENHPEASFGVHLNLTQGKALTKSDVFLKNGIVDEHNYFTKNIRNTNLNDSEIRDAIYKEWDAQISKVIIDEGIQITHFDGHHHIHADYELMDILVSLSKKWNIKIVRSRYLYSLGGED